MNPIEQAIKEHEARFHKKREKRTPKADMGYTSSFENFWKLFKGRWVKDEGVYGGYNKGSKVEAFEVWKKLSETDRQAATKSAPASAGIYTQDCCRWLKYKRWEK